MAPTESELATARTEVWVEVFREQFLAVNKRLEHMEAQLAVIARNQAEQQGAKRATAAFASTIGALVGGAVAAIVNWWLGKGS